MTKAKIKWNSVPRRPTARSKKKNTAKRIGSVTRKTKKKRK